MQILLHAGSQNSDSSENRETHRLLNSVLLHKDNFRAAYGKFAIRLYCS